MTGRALATLMRKEASAWVRSHAWWSQPLIFSLVLVGSMAIPLVLLRETFAGEPGGLVGAAAGVFASLGAVVPALGGVLWFQNSLIGERQEGTAAWVLSKPVPRWTLPVAKLLVHGGLLSLAAIVIPGVLAYLVLTAEAGSQVPAGPFSAAVGVLALHAAFYATLTLALSAVAQVRGVIVAVPLALLLGGDLILGVAPILARSTPWLLGRGAGLLAQGQPFPVPEALLATALWSVAAIGFALWRFGRQDL